MERINLQMSHLRGLATIALAGRSMWFPVPGDRHAPDAANFVRDQLVASASSDHLRCKPQTYPIRAYLAGPPHHRHLLDLGRSE
jgi:hypothetical protein